MIRRDRWTGRARMADKDLKDIVKAKYGQAALRVTSGGSACCGSAPSRGECDPITSNLYDAGETAGLPAQAGAAALGCGHPTALAALRPGDIVLDLGSGDRKSTRLNSSH